MDTEATHRDPRLPARDECVLRYVLQKWSRLKPDQVYAKFHRGRSITYGEMETIARKVAAGLSALGVKQGDTVVVWLPNSLECLAAWFGINWLGAVYVPINTAYKGRLLEHVLANSDARLMIAHTDLMARLDGIDLAKVSHIVEIGGNSGGPCSATVLPESALDGEPDRAPEPDRPIEPWDVQSIVYTSGTTGPSKGVLSSYAQLHAMAGTGGFYMVTAQDRYLCNLPLFHVGGTIPAMGMLCRGGSVSFVASFSTEEFWSSINETQTTVVLLLGAMATFIAKTPPGPADRAHCLRSVIIVPLAENAPAFAERFGVTVYTLYNMTEISTPLVSGPNPTKTGICGKPRDGVELRLVDGNDCEVRAGETGELIVRADAPWTLNSGYNKNPEATVKAWRNGWFHTGDAFRINEDGDYVFVDRMKDTIRRRGENISSFEVEAEVAAHPHVNEVAVVPVPSELSEDDILCVVAPTPGQSIDPEELLNFLLPRLAHFMVPRYVRVVSELPRTPTAKIQKNLLRDEGLTNDTWDREAAGIRIRRERIG
ncbi:MAG: AMP-binding protein [Rhodopseudomonas palustris]|uniref:AMP-binding protein n=1 Tax=Rhodopseudomonas palustris TaxID=1076 RepID=A0A933S5T8_RHOPL|nr:AMP-binding protein [Rhodopseudomonas palustris]